MSNPPNLLQNATIILPGKIFCDPLKNARNQALLGNPIAGTGKNYMKNGKAAGCTIDFRMRSRRSRYFMFPEGHYGKLCL